MNFSIVVPLFNEAENINQLNLEILEAIKQLQNNNHQFEIIYIDDGSTDNTLETLKKIDNNVKTIVLKNHFNLAQSKSILNGIEISNNNNIILLDGDLQNDPKDIIKMIEIYEKNENILVHGYRKNRNDPFLTKVLPSKIANFIVRIFTNSNILDHGCSLKIFDKRIINVNNFFGDFHRLFAAQINKEIKIIELEVSHRPRIKGKSKYGFERVFRVFIDLIFIKLSRNENSYFYTIGFMGLLSFLLSLTSFTYMVYLKIFANKSFIATPLPVLFVFFALAGLIFFSIILMLETIKKMFREENTKIKNFTICKKN
tara:strand:+ start:1855 stop:2796 length:942 start_codon:yes stop_codon:yes gene_type:complete